MKYIFTLLLTTLVLSFSSCDLINELIPDVDTDFSTNFQIQIFANSGQSDEEIVDVTTSDEYNSFKGNIQGFELRKITYQLKNANVPSDMYCSGNVICSNEENTESYIVGSIAKANISELGSDGVEHEALESAENIDKVLAWLDSPGKFKLKAGYIITNADGTPYLINGVNAGSNFELEIKFYVTVKTKAK